MDRIDIAGILFGLVGVASLLRLAIDPVSGSTGLFSALIGIGFLVLGAVNILREREPLENSGRSVVIPAVAVITFAIGVGVSIVI